MTKLNYADQKLIWRKRRERAQALRDAGLTFVEIAKQIKCSPQRVHQLLNKQKVTA